MDAAHGVPRRAASGSIVAYNTTHVPWQGCSLHDLIQPAFSFLVGAALPFSIASRRARGETFRPHARARHLAQRGLDPPRHLPAIAASGRRPTGRSKTRSRRSASATRSCSCWRSRSLRVQIAVVRRDPRRRSGRRSCCIRCPARASTTRRSACRADWPHLYTGFLAHFNKNSNLSWAFDVWFLNLFPRESPFRFNSGGWSTLSFIPTLATMSWAVGRASGCRRRDRRSKS